MIFSIADVLTTFDTLNNVLVWNYSKVDGMYIQLICRKVANLKYKNSLKIHWKWISSQVLSKYFAEKLFCRKLVNRISLTCLQKFSASGISIVVGCQRVEQGEVHSQGTNTELILCIFPFSADKWGRPLTWYQVLNNFHILFSVHYSLVPMLMHRDKR